MNIIVGCEQSGIVREAFKARGHNAWSCDVDPTEIPGQHYQEDLFSVLERTKGYWDIGIFHPPCTFLCNSGVKWLYKGGKKENGRDLTRWENMYKGAEFFNQIKDCGIPKYVIENPIPHGYALGLIGKYSQVIQPWMFGHPEKKATCLWVHNLPLLQETNNVRHLMKNMAKKDTDRNHYISGKDRGKKRSITYPGIAKALAEQMGKE
jgi:hypothetical protein